MICNAVSGLVVQPDQLMLTMVCYVRNVVLTGEVDGMPMTVGSVGWTGIFSSNPVTVNWQLSL
jgi:hypothetical protein